ncbi:MULTISPECIES: hypothetical protein [Achromobacter]|uniref:Uncharacterized protein n=1 Tax=Achromobacter xylosoxidans (strain A8) TaxID=762376 RepID=E3HY68_ACHXA|nr:hypothetical protein [Achromobacter xylosoxidans]ADP20022.1 hypothetical protein AXYL_06738 [Achromobacter xylosoxidans A8]
MPDKVKLNEAIILRTALQSAITYLERLPRVPETRAMIQELENALVRADEALPDEGLIARAYTPIGEVLVEALLRGEQLLLTTDLERGRATALWTALAVGGLQLQLQELDHPAPG